MRGLRGRCTTGRLQVWLRKRFGFGVSLSGAKFPQCGQTTCPSLFHSWATATLKLASPVTWQFCWKEVHKTQQTSHVHLIWIELPTRWSGSAEVIALASGWRPNVTLFATLQQRPLGRWHAAVVQTQPLWRMASSQIAELAEGYPGFISTHLSVRQASLAFHLLLQFATVSQMWSQCRPACGRGAKAAKVQGALISLWSHGGATVTCLKQRTDWLGKNPRKIWSNTDSNLHCWGAASFINERLPMETPRCSSTFWRQTA